jgi:hypothetical protein
VRISFTMPDPLFKFVQHLHTKHGLSVSAAINHIVLTHTEFVAYEKDLARQAAEAAKASTKTTVVVEARPTREQMLAEEQERRRRIREQEAHPPWPTPPEQENKEAFCHHGNQVSDSAGYEVFCFECSVEAGHEVCHEHREAKPCPHCSMDEIGEAAP